MKNLILISLDTVRSDVAYSQKFPTINSLRSDGVTFINTYSSSPLTPCSHATVLSGLQPYNHGLRHLFKEKMNKEVKTMAQIFKQNGYSTGAVVSCPGMNSWYGFGRGFDFFDDTIPKLADGSDPLLTIDVKLRGTALKRAPLVVDIASKWIDEHKEDKFLFFLHFFDAHWPYNAPEDFCGDNPYEKEVGYTDHYLGLFLEKLKQMGLYEDTSIVCFSDHGEDLEGLYNNDKGGKKLGHPEESGHGCLLYNQTQKVIFTIKHSSFPSNFDIENQVRLVDVAPTVFELFDIKTNGMNFDGISLAPLVIKNKQMNLPAYCETFYPQEQNETNNNKFSHAKNKKAVVIENKYKIIIEMDSDKLETYDLDSDPDEKRNLIKNV